MTDPIFITLAKLLDFIQKNNLTPAIILFFLISFFIGQKNKHEADKRNIKNKKVRTGVQTNLKK